LYIPSFPDTHSRASSASNVSEHALDKPDEGQPKKIEDSSRCGLAEMTGDCDEARLSLHSLGNREKYFTLAQIHQEKSHTFLRFVNRTVNIQPLAFQAIKKRLGQEVFFSAVLKKV